MTFLNRLRSPTNVFNLPNLLTMTRIAMIPLIAVLLAYDAGPPPLEQDWMFRFSPGRVASFLVIIAGITDYLDGWLARRWGIDSLLGKFLDPVADKLFLMVSLIMLMELGRVADWLVIALLSREFLITALRGVAVGEGLVISASQAGKWKLTVQMVGLGFLMWYGSVFGLSGVKIGLFILYIALFISLSSGYLYLSDFFTALKNKRGSILVKERS